MKKMLNSLGISILLVIIFAFTASYFSSRLSLLDLQTTSDIVFKLFSFRFGIYEISIHDGES